MCSEPMRGHIVLPNRWYRWIVQKRTVIEDGVVLCPRRDDSFEVVWTKLGITWGNPLFNIWFNWLCHCGNDPGESQPKVQMQMGTLDILGRESHRVSWLSVRKPRNQPWSCRLGNDPCVKWGDFISCMYKRRRLMFVCGNVADSRIRFVFSMVWYGVSHLEHSDHLVRLVSKKHTLLCSTDTEDVLMH